jgi:hypothetical protein
LAACVRRSIDHDLEQSSREHFHHGEVQMGTRGVGEREKIIRNAGL